MYSILLAIIYMAFISLGLPDSLLGSAWPSMYKELNVPVSYSGIIFMIIAAGTVVSSLQSDRLTKRFGTGKVTAFSVMTTAIALFGFSMSRSYIALCLWAIPYGLGAGSVDASLNNYVALNYAGKHMSWLHCMWGIGASVGPYIMGAVLTAGHSWTRGYFVISAIQVVLTAILLLSLPLWKGSASETEGPDKAERPIKLKEIVRIPGAKEIMTAFFCYSAIEQTTSLWASGYLVFHHGLSTEEAASLAGLFFIGITVGRLLSGFLAVKLSDTSLIRLGCAVIFIGTLLLLLPLGKAFAICGLVTIGLGCAPIYPSIIHSTPAHFGADNSQAVIGVEMAAAYIGTCLMPPVFGVIAAHITTALFPVYILFFLCAMAFMYAMVVRKSGK